MNENDYGRYPDGSGDSAQPEPSCTVSAVPVSIPNADEAADAAERLGRLYREIQSREYACSEIVCVYPHDGNCWCFNTALAQHVAQEKAR